MKRSLHPWLPWPGSTVNEQRPFANTTLCVAESRLVKRTFPFAYIVNVPGDGPVAVSPTRQPQTYPQFGGCGALFDALANSPAAVATAATRIANVASRLFISVPPSGG